MEQKLPSSKGSRRKKSHGVKTTILKEVTAENIAWIKNYHPQRGHGKIIA